MIERIVRMARVARSGDTSHALIRLKPPEMGEVRIELAVREGVVHSKLEVVDVAARNLLEGHLNDLRGALADEGLEVGSFEVNVRHNGEGPHQRMSSDRPGGYGSEDGSGESRDEDLPQRENQTRSGHEGSIDYLA